MSKVIIKSTELREVRGKRNGQVWFLQTAGLDTGSDFPKSFDIFHDDKSKAYPVGEYAFAVDAIYAKDVVGTDGRTRTELKVSPRLVPLGKVASSKVA